MTLPLFAYQMCRDNCTQGQIKYLDLISKEIERCIIKKKRYFNFAVPSISDKIEKDKEYLDPIFSWIWITNLSNSFYKVNCSVNFINDKEFTYGKWDLTVFVKSSGLAESLGSLIEKAKSGLLDDVEHKKELEKMDSQIEDHYFNVNKIDIEYLENLKKLELKN